MEYLSIEQCQALKEAGFQEIPGFEGRYLIDREGTLYSVPRIKTKGGYLKKTIRDDYAGYNLTVSHTNYRWYPAHRLMALTFLGQPYEPMQVNHKNGIKDDNRLENLEWCTGKQNIRHRIETLGVDLSGTRNGRAKLTEADIKQIRKRYAETPEGAWTIAKDYGVAPGHITDIINRKRWRHI